MNRPAYLFAAWDAIRDQVRRARRLALFTDFDGTLVRICCPAANPRLPARIRRLLDAIARSGTTVGVVSGRTLEDVRSRVGLKRIWYVGAHGYFLQDPASSTTCLLSPKKKQRIQRFWRELPRQLPSVPGIWMENKEASIAVHYRGARPRVRESARAAVAHTIEKIPGLSLLSGKKVWEVLPRGRVDKWAAIRFILRRERQQRTPGRWLVFYLGDDATDECVFEKMTGISIVVGRRLPTSARYFLHSPPEVRQFLGRWTEMTS